jgi:hypothetical protein
MYKYEPKHGALYKLYKIKIIHKSIKKEMKVKNKPEIPMEESGNNF